MKQQRRQHVAKTAYYTQQQLVHLKHKINIKLTTSNNTKNTVNFKYAAVHVRQQSFSLPPFNELIQQ